MIGRWIAALAVFTTLASAQFSNVTITATTTGADGVVTVPYPPSCTAVSPQVSAVYYNNTGNEYYFNCGWASGTLCPYSRSLNDADTVPGGSTFATQPANLNWRDCLTWCETTSGCTGFSFNNPSNGAAYGEASGSCNLKNVNPEFFVTTQTTSVRVAAVMRAYCRSPHAFSPAEPSLTFSDVV